MPVYYVDNVNGCDENDGLSPEKAKSDHAKIDVRAGDTLLFKRGTIYRQRLTTFEGSAGAWITYGAYGAGAPPVFCGSTDVSKREDWVEIDKNIWECKKEIPGETGNFEFDKNNCTATLRWSRDELCAQGDFWDSRLKGDTFYPLKESLPPQQVLLCSFGNPADVYSHIECISRNERVLSAPKPYNRYSGLCFRNSGLHGIAGKADHVEIINCIFENIGGCAWNNEREIRLGNGVEFYGHGSYILIEGCRFKNIYDSCITHQGPGAKTVPAREFICRSNVFDTYSMAAFEYRDKMPIDSAFIGNTCLNAGCGFGMLGESIPRKSEIWPKPMGHHVFMWRIPEAENGGGLKIEGNFFGEAKHGAAIYSIISPEAESQVKMDKNMYMSGNSLLIRWSGKDFSSLEEYSAATGQDKNSIYIK